MSVQMTYTGATGDVNYDVARETGGPARMKNGERYTVSEELASRLLYSAVWRAPKSRETELLKEEAKENEAPEERTDDAGTGGERGSE